MTGLGKTCQFCFESPLWQEIFRPRKNMVMLSKAFRQNDGEFLAMLSELREGIVSSNTDRILTNKVAQYRQSVREAQGDNSEYPLFQEDSAPEQNDKMELEQPEPPAAKIIPTKLFSTNAQVDSINGAELRKLATAAHVYMCREMGSERDLKQLWEGIRAPRQLELRIGCQVLP